MATRKRTACLVVIFNHFFPGNVEKLTKLYAQRFSRIVFLLPNGSIDRADCYTVYRGPLSFHGYIADAAHFVRDRTADYYLFIGDDVLLNPNWDESDYFDALGLDNAEGFCPSPEPFQGKKWAWSTRIITRVFMPKSILYGTGTENAAAHLPPRDVTRARFAALGFHDTTIKFTDGQGKVTNLEPPFPLAAGISDFFALRAEAFADFAHYCGVFASLDLFVESAIPTALIYACKTLRTTRAPWHYDWNFTVPGETPGADWAGALAKFDDHMLFLHPLKFSAIAMDLL